MFKTAERTELNQISLTGMRAIVLVGLLIVKPRSLEEIRKAFISLNIMENENSYDILRIDINTLKIMGCEISRASQKTGYKYVLGKHPFALKIEDDEIKVLKRAYDRIKGQVELPVLMEYDELFKKIAYHMDDEEKKEQILGISALKYFDIQTIKDIANDCSQNRTLDLIYKKPTTNLEARKEVVAQKLVYKNDKIYLYGYDLEKQESIVLNVKRIKSILARKLKKEGIEEKVIKIKFHLKGFDVYNLEDGETVLEALDNGFIVEGGYHNEFLAAQRMLSFGTRCTVLEPAEFKENIIAKLKEMRKTYEY